MQSQSELRRRGESLLQQLHGSHSGAAMVAEMREVCPDFADMTIEWAIGGIMGRPGLDLLTRQLVLVAASTMISAMPQLRAHVEAALQAGATRDQIVETILQLTFYGGGPAVRNGLMAVQDIIGPAPAGRPAEVQGQ